MDDTSLFFSSRPAYPWSAYPIGLPALALVGVLLVAFTLWAYLGHPQATRRRVIIVLALRIAALLVTLLTALRPSVGFQEEPKVPSFLFIGIDASESMTVKDEVNGQARIDAVRKTMERCQPLLDELAEQNVNVLLYKFSTPDFNPETSRYEPNAPADGKRSDYGTYLNRAFEKWQGERFVRGHLLIGDGADNGSAFPAANEAGRWGRRGVPVTTFTVGSDDTTHNAKDIAIVALSADPERPAIKTDVTIVAKVNAFGYAGSRVKAKVFFNDEEVRVEEVELTKERDSEVRITVKAPAAPGEVKVRVELPVLPGEVSPLNNVSETYLTVTKEGVRVLIIDRMRTEETLLRDALRAEKRFDLYEVLRQTNLPLGPDEAQWLDLDAQGYDAVIIGNVSFDQLPAGFADKVIERVTKKGMGLMFLGGEASFTNYPPAPTGDPKDRPFAFADLLPVVPSPGVIVESVNAMKQPTKFYQTVPTEKGFTDHIMRVDKDAEQAKRLWNDLNNPAARPQPRISGYVKMARKPAATLYAWATDAPNPPDPKLPPPPGADPLLVGHQIGEGDRGRVLAFAAYDTYLWETLGQPKSRQGIEIHDRFWKQCVLWLAHQEEEEGQAYARPQFRRLPVGGDQTIRVGLKTPAGDDDPNAELLVKILPPGLNKPEDEEKAPRQTVLRDPKGAKVLFKPSAAGEYSVVVASPMKDKDGKPVLGPDGKPRQHRGTARFLAFPDVSDEMIRVAANHDFFEKVAAASGGKALRLEDLPGFLKDLKGQPLETIKPKPRYLPDWRRNHSKGFLPGWLALFVALLGTEWGLRRYWGMV